MATTLCGTIQPPNSSPFDVGSAEARISASAGAGYSTRTRVEYLGEVGTGTDLAGEWGPAYIQLRIRLERLRLRTRCVDSQEPRGIPYHAILEPDAVGPDQSIIRTAFVSCHSLP